MIRLLIADDECLEREALTEMVSRRFEHEAVLETAENGRKAADTAILWGADLILMDIEMPGMSGLDAARAVLAQRPGCRVIFVTAYSLFSMLTRLCIWEPVITCSSPWTRTSWKPPSGGPCARSRQSASWRHWPRCSRSRWSLLPRRQNRTMPRTARTRWSWPMCGGIWRITICSISRWTV